MSGAGLLGSANQLPVGIFTSLVITNGATDVQSIKYLSGTDYTVLCRRCNGLCDRLRKPNARCSGHCNWLP